jgi:hypothetical protein
MGEALARRAEEREAERKGGVVLCLGRNRSEGYGFSFFIFY